MLKKPYLKLSSLSCHPCSDSTSFIRPTPERIVAKLGNSKDIVQYVFVYIPTIGYVTEFQIGHPFASYTFRIDSTIRDRRDAGLNTDDLVSLWKAPNGMPSSECFYNKMRSKILDPGLDFDVRKGIDEAFGDKPVDPELELILKEYL